MYKFKVVPKLTRDSESTRLCPTCIKLIEGSICKVQDYDYLYKINNS